MIDLHSRAIAQIKLNELQRQRQILRDHYVRLGAAVAAATDPRERLRLLYTGLREAKFAQKPLHPDVANLEAVFFEADLGTASPEMIAECQTRLEQEMAQGLLRAEFSAIYGHFLDEWLASDSDRPPAPIAGQTHPFDEKLQLFWTSPDRPLDHAPLTALFDKFRPIFDAIRMTIQGWADKEAQAGVTTELVKGILKILGNDITRAPEIRRHALDTANNPLLINELAGALTVLLNNLDDWDWPEEGFELRPLWSRTKWRPYLDEDLLTLLFQNLIGLRWGVLLRQVFGTHFNLAHGFHLPGAHTPFHEKTPGNDANDPLAWVRTAQHVKLFMPMVPASLDQLQERGGYGGYESRNLTPDQTDTFQELLLFVNAEIRLHEASAPEQPLHVVQTDLRDFYLRIPHEVVLFIVENLGFPPRWLNFFKKFLAVRVRRHGKSHVVCRGLMLDHILSDVLAEYLLLFLDLHVFESAGVRLMRVVDDIFFVSSDRQKTVRAWKSLVGFCQAVGLEINEGKSGSLTLGNETIPELPQGPPRWGMLRLTAKGQWELDPDNWLQFQNIMRRQLKRPMPVLTLISLYNSSLSYVLKFLGMLAPLGRVHRQQIAEAAARMHHGLFADKHGLVEEVRRRWQSKIDNLAEQRIPEALYYWPLTAGGLGLFNPSLALSAHHEAALSWKAPIIPIDVDIWQKSFGQKWASFFQSWLQPIVPRVPVATPGLEALLSDFVARSGEVSGRATADRKQKEKKRGRNLSLYWQWAVYTYGPQLLTTLGTFRFLITELVPLQVIVQNRIGASSLSDHSSQESQRDF